ncbi:MAG: MATE family efflux transporter [Pseudomonadota bacterium]|nr:MATE family efflux transporter [Pseudomonadota bacterium]
MRSHISLGPVDRLWHLAWPLIIANIATPLLGLADAAIAGHLDQAYYLAAVTVGAELLVIFFGTFSFLRMGTTGLVAQAVGSDDQAHSFRIVANAVLLALGIGSLLLLAGAQAIDPLLQFAKPTAEITNPLHEYLVVRLWGAPANLTLITLTGWFIGQGLTRVALYLSVGINILNILCNYLLAIELQLNSYGIALGTVISEYAGAVIASCVLWKRFALSGIVICSIQASSLWLQLVKINTPLMLRTILLHSVFVTLSVFAARLGVQEAAAIGLILVLLATAAYALDGFAYASEIEAGQALGERHFIRFTESLWAGAILSAVSTTIIVLIANLFHGQLFQTLTDFQDVVTKANALMTWFTWILLALCWSYWLDGVFIGVTKTVDMCLAMCVATAFGWYGGLWLMGTNSLDQLMAAFLIFSAIRTITLAARLPAVVFELKRLSIQTHPKS